MLGRLDEEHLALAAEHGRVLFTHDADFLRLHSQEFPHTGIVYTHQSSSISRMIRGLMLVHEVLVSEDMIGHLEYI
jgi:predicted nuclease of predicted toxin-antitoxin system